jgi:hypothetical protein
VPVDLAVPRKQGRNRPLRHPDLTAQSGGWDVLLLDGDGELELSKHFWSEVEAQHVAEFWRQDYVRAGYDAEEVTRRASGVNLTTPGR